MLKNDGQRQVIVNLMYRNQKETEELTGYIDRYSIRCCPDTGKVETYVDTVRTRNDINILSTSIKIDSNNKRLAMLLEEYNKKVMIEKIAEILDKPKANSKTILYKDMAHQKYRGML